MKVQLYDDQYDFVLDESKILLADGGVGSGKTVAAAFKLYKLCMDNPGLRALCGGVTFSQVKYSAVSEILSFVGDGNVRHNRSDHTIEFPNGSIIFYRGLDEEHKIKGTTIGVAYVDELTEIKKEIYYRILGNLRQKGMPLQFIATTNPSTFDNFVYEDLIKSSVAKHYHFATIGNPFLPEETIEGLKRIEKTNPSWYKRNVLGSWGALEGLVYELPKEQRKLKLKEYDSIVCGVDFGFTAPSAFVVIGISSGIVEVIDERYKHRMTSNEIKLVAKELMDIYKIERFVCDSARPEIIQDMLNDSIPAEPSIKGVGSVESGIQFVQSLIGEKRLYVSPNCIKTLQELDSYILDESIVRKTQQKLDQPLKKNDHCMDALRYIITASLIEPTVDYAIVADIQKSLTATH